MCIYLYTYIWSSCSDKPLYDHNNIIQLFNIYYRILTFIKSYPILQRTCNAWSASHRNLHGRVSLRFRSPSYGSCRARRSKTLGSGTQWGSTEDSNHQHQMDANGRYDMQWSRQIPAEDKVASYWAQIDRWIMNYVYDISRNIEGCSSDTVAM